ncbi:hypothetical protein GCM10023339_76670 [Alloalcanivorax gelatiniphagus]
MTDCNYDNGRHRFVRCGWVQLPMPAMLRSVDAEKTGDRTLRRPVRGSAFRDDTKETQISIQLDHIPAIRGV